MLRALGLLVLAVLVATGCGGDRAVPRACAAIPDVGRVIAESQKPPGVHDIASEATSFPVGEGLRRALADPDGPARLRAALRRIATATAALDRSLADSAKLDPTATTNPDLGGGLFMRRAGVVVVAYRRARAAADAAGIERCGALASADRSAWDDYVSVAFPSPAPAPQAPVPTAASVAARTRLTAGRDVALQAGCLACHRLGADGGDLGPDLTRVGARLSRVQLRRALVRPVAPMPSFKALPPAQLRALLDYLHALR